MSKTSKRLAELNERFRFVEVDMSDPAWSEVDEGHRETVHSTVRIHLSHYGYTQDDPFYVFDDVTVDEAVKRVWREHCR